MNCKLPRSLLLSLAALCAGAAFARAEDWRGRRIAYLGDSITDVRHIGCTRNYWNFLKDDLGVTPLVYGINGQQMLHLLAQAEKLKAEHAADIDAISVFAGTNDYNANVPLGAWFVETTETVDRNGHQVAVKHREFSFDEKTFRGRINRLMRFLRENFPTKPILLLPPINRGYATFGPKNVQPDEVYANELGLFVDAYVDAVKEAGNIWAATVVDINAESGLFPHQPQHALFFHNAKTDMLHPNDRGHRRIAHVVAAALDRVAPPDDGNDTARLRATVEELKDGGTLVLPKREYHLFEDGAKRIWLDPSNNASGEKIVAMPVVGKQNVVIDGSGSTFVCHGRVFPFVALKSRNVTFRNFTVTTRYPSCAGFKVEAKDDAGFTVQFDAGVCPYRVDEGAMTFLLDGHEISSKNGRLSLHALDRIVIHYLMAPQSKGDKGEFPAPFVGVAAEDLGNRRVRFRYYGDKHPKSAKLPYRVGEQVVVNLEEQRYRDVFFFEDCAGVTVEDVAIERFGGMGIVGQRSVDLAVRRLTTPPRAGERVTLTADILQFINCGGKLAIEDCACGWSLDDVINIHGNYLRVESVAGKKAVLRAKHVSHAGFFPYRPGDALEVVDARTRNVLLRTKAVGFAPDPQDRYACTLEVADDLSKIPAGALVENATLNPDVVIRGNHFHDHPNMRLSGRGKYLVEGNRIERCCSALVGMDLAEYWYESGRISEMTIRDNVFRDCNALGGGTFLNFGVSGWGADAPKIHGRVVLEGNRFEQVRQHRWSFAGVQEVVDRNLLGAPKETPVAVPFPRIGSLAPRTAPDPKDDQWMIGCEVLDRDFAKFAAYKAYLPALGIRSIRLQGGWAKCEKEKGKYDFAWLDESVDYALAHGLNPVLETGYGNPIYKGGGGRDLAAGFPSSEEGLQAWDRWVDALSKHFKGRVKDWAMWNEPDIGNPAETAAVGGHHTPANIAAFNVRTAKTILKNIPDARIAGLSLATNDPAFNEACYQAFGEDIGLFWRFIYHGYVPAPEDSYANVQQLKALCAKYAPKATLWQGENGAPSEMPGDGLALNHLAWSEISQAKWDMRRMLGDFVHGVPSSVFTISDYFHPGRGIGSYGLLRADANRDVIAVKRAFHAVRNVATVFDSHVARVPRKVSSPENTLQLWEFARDGKPLFAFWTCGEWRNPDGKGWKVARLRPGDGLATRPAVIEWTGAPLADPVWVDLLTGAVHEFPKDRMLRRAGGTTFVDVPVYDSPCLLTERAALPLAALK